MDASQGTNRPMSASSSFSFRGLPKRPDNTQVMRLSKILRRANDRLLLSAYDCNLAAELTILEEPQELDAVQFRHVEIAKYEVDLFHRTIEDLERVTSVGSRNRRFSRRASEKTHPLWRSKSDRHQRSEPFPVRLLQV